MLEQNLKIIKDSQLDVEILRRQNEKLCQENNAEIEKLKETIEVTEIKLESELKESGEKKLECPLGYASYRTMPDKWEYDEPILLDWMEANEMPYYYKMPVIEKANLKRAIQDSEIKIGEVKGLTVTPQEEKFYYKVR